MSPEHPGVSECEKTLKKEKKNKTAQCWEYVTKTCKPTGRTPMAKAGII